MKRSQRLGPVLIALGAMCGSGCGALLPADLGQPYTGAPVSQDTYGLTPETAIPLGNVTVLSGGRAFIPSSASTRVIGDYLQYLTGPRGEPIRYTNTGKCCSFPSPRGDAARSLVTYEVYRPDGTPVKLYFNLYKSETPRAPAGFVLLPAYFEPR